MNFKKTLLATLTTIIAIGIYASSFRNFNSNSPINASWGSETVRIYLDKTLTIQGLGWWQTDDTFINFQDGSGNWTNSKMTKETNNLFYHDIGGEVWDTVNSNSQGLIEFWVYNSSAPQNIVAHTQLWWLKSNEFNYFRLNSSNGNAKQTYTIENKEVEIVAYNISQLNCNSDTATVQDVVDDYNSLRSAGKNEIQSRIISGAAVSHYQRLKMIAASKLISV